MFPLLFYKKYFYILTFLILLCPISSFGAYVPFTGSFPKSLTAQGVYVARINTVGNLESVFEKKGDTALPIASVTKILTALTAGENISLDKKITITQKALNTEGSMGYLPVNKTYTLKTLLKPLLVASSNDVAEALALSYGRDTFLQKMRDTATRLGLSTLSLYSPSGLDDVKTGTPNTLSAHDVAVLYTYMYKNEPDLFYFTTLRTYTDPANTLGRKHIFNATNRLYRIPLYNEYIVGSKTGSTTKAKYAIVFIVKHKSLKNEYVVSILRSDSLYTDSIKIINEIKKYDKSIK